MTSPILYGPGYSTYVRSARLTLVEKGVDYRFVEVDFLQGMPEEQLARHPFGKVPAFEHAGLQLYETCAIERYVDEAFTGPALQPVDPAKRAMVAQIVGILDSYAYGSMIQKIMLPRIVVPMMGGTPDEAAIREALPLAERCVAVLDGFIGERRHLVDDSLTLADLHAVPILTYFRLAPEGAAMLDTAPNLLRWYAAMHERDSVRRLCPAEVKSP